MTREYETGPTVWLYPTKRHHEEVAMSTIRAPLLAYASGNEELLSHLAEEMRSLGHTAEADELLKGEMPGDEEAAIQLGKIKRLINDSQTQPELAMSALLEHLQVRANARTLNAESEMPVIEATKRLLSGATAGPTGDLIVVTGDVAVCSSRQQAMEFMNEAAEQGRPFRLFRGVEVKVKTKVVEIEG